MLHRPLLLPLVLAALLPALSHSADEFRTWTSADGRKLEAALQGVEGASVKIKLRNGTLFTLPLDRLSAEDQAFVKSKATATGKDAAAASSGAEKSWPRSVVLDDPPQPRVVKEDAEKKEFVYQSEHYEFRCDSKLGTNVVREFSRIFEATWLLNCKLPLNLQPAPEEGQERFVALLYTNKEDYFKNGGIQGSAGVYQSRQKALSVPLDSLGVKMVGKRVTLEQGKDDDNATLIHEITHQMMNHWLGRLPTWYIEGSAEAVEMLEYQHGRFSLSQFKQRLRNYLQRQGGDGKNFVMLDPTELFTLDGETWSAALGISNRTAAQNYASACLMTCFFYYMDDKGDGANLIAWLAAIKEAGKRDAHIELAQKHLLRERSIDQLKEELRKAYRKEGIDLTFAAPGKNGPVSSGTK